MTTLQQVLARLLTDVEFRDQVHATGETALRDYMLSVEDVKALSQLDLSLWGLSNHQLSAGGPTDVGRGGSRDGGMPDRA